MLQSKIFANGCTTLPQPVREALAVKVGDTVHYVISKKRADCKSPISDCNHRCACAERSVLNWRLYAATLGY